MAYLFESEGRSTEIYVWGPKPGDGVVQLTGDVVVRRGVRDMIFIEPLLQTTTFQKGKMTVHAVGEDGTRYHNEAFAGAMINQERVPAKIYLACSPAEEAREIGVIKWE